MKHATAMLRRAAAALLAACALGPGAAAAVAGPDDARACPVEREKLLAQDLKSFDQGPEGWRSLASQDPACAALAAGLIADYRARHPDILRRNPNAYLLYWHEGQIHASNGDSPRALALFEQARMGFAQWDLYVDATIAFLQQDRPALLRARAALAATPPEEYRPLPAPLNLDFVDGFIQCFGKTYREAYGACRAAPAGEKPAGDAG